MREPIQQRSRDKKKRIVNGARKLFNRDGYDSVNTHRIAAEAGVSVGTLYSYFGNKRDIMIKVIHQYMDELTRHLANAIKDLQDKSVDRKERIEIIVRCSIDRHRKSARLHREIMGLVIKDPEIQAVYYKNTYKLIHLYQSVLDIPSSDTDTFNEDAAGFVIHVSIEQMIHRLLFFEVTPGIDAEAIVTELVSLIEYYCQGISNRN